MQVNLMAEDTENQNFTADMVGQNLEEITARDNKATLDDVAREAGI